MLIRPGEEKALGAPQSSLPTGKSVTRLKPHSDGGWMRDMRHRWKQDKFRLEIKQNFSFCAQGAQKHCEGSTLGDFQNCIKP